MFLTILKSRFAWLDGHMQEVLAGASSSLAIRILGTLLGFGVSVLIARLLGADGTGIYYLALSVATIASTIGRLGFDNTVVRFVASHASQSEWSTVRYVRREVTRLVVGASLFIAAALGLLAPLLAVYVFNKPALNIPLVLASVTVTPMSLMVINSEALRGLRYIAISQWISTVLVSLCSLLLIYPFVTLWDTNGALAAYAMATVIAAVAALIAWSKKYREALYSASETDSQSGITMKSLIESSWPLFGVTLAGMVIQNAAIVTLGILGTTEDVGIFTVANRLASLLLFPLIAMISILSPKFAVMHKQGTREDLARLARRSSLMLTIFALPAAGVVWISADWILAVFGPSFQSGTLILRILLIGVLVNGATGAVAELLMMSGHEKDCRTINIVGALLVLSLSLALVPWKGGIGAALAVSTGVSLKNIMMVFMVKARLGFWAIAI